MKSYEAEKILHNYNKWRRGAKMSQPAPKEIGLAIDQAIRMFRKIRKYETKNCEENSEKTENNNSL